MVIVANADPALAAVVVKRTPMHLDERVDGALDTSVRSASSIVRFRDGIAVIQDDVNIVAVFDEDGTRGRAIALPPGEGGHRRFDDKRGNKAHKLDLEASIVVTGESGEMLLAFGSGSTDRREAIAILSGLHAELPDVSVVHVPLLYETLRREKGFAGSALNIEGAIQLGRWVRLFGRGNGATREGVTPVNASCDLGWHELLAHLRAPDTTAPPSPANVVRYELGALDGVPLGFTDVTAWRDAIYYSAAAEDSPDAVRDGRVAGSAIGVIGKERSARWAPVTEHSGATFAAKIEGLLPVVGGADKLYVVVDSDDPDATSDLCTVELRGPWR